MNKTEKLIIATAGIIVLSLIFGYMIATSDLDPWVKYFLLH